MLSRPVSPTLVGRNTELTMLAGAYNRAATKAATVIALGGEAGVGKTRLVTTFAEETAAKGGRVLTGGCVELSAEGLAYAPFTAALRQLVRETGIQGVTELLPEGAARDLARLLPEFGAADQEPDMAEARARLFEQLLTLCERLAERNTLVLVIEDAHWADRSTRDLLGFFARNLRSARVLMVVTYRSDELHRAHPLRPVLAELSRLESVVRVDLPRLSRADVSAQMAGILGRDPEPARIDGVYERSEGIPLFVEALLDHHDEARLPESLADLVAVKLEGLPEPCQRVLRVAAVGGARVGHRLLATVTGLDDGDLESAIRPAITAGVMATDGDGYAFRHALICEAVGEELLPGERNRLHVRFAEVIGEDDTLVPPGRAAIEIAHHWYRARDPVRALTAAWRAAEEAERALAYAEVVHLLERVLDLWDRVPDAAGRLGADRTRVLERAADTAIAGGDSDRGHRFVQGALRELDQDREPERVAHMLVQRAAARSQMSRPGQLDDLRTAERLLPEPGRGRARVLTRLAGAIVLAHTGLAEARTACVEAGRLAREAGDTHLEIDTQITEALLTKSAGDINGSLAVLEAARDSASRAGDPALLLRSQVNIAADLEDLGRSAEAVALADKAIETAMAAGRYRSLGMYLELNRVESLVSLGRWAEAEQATDHALSYHPNRKMYGAFIRERGYIAVARGDYDLADEAVAQSFEIFDQPHVTPQGRVPAVALRIALLRATGRTDEAADAAARALDTDRALLTSPLSWPLLMQIHLAGDDTGRAEARELADRVAGGTVPPSPVWDAYHMMVREDYDGAAALWETAHRPYLEAHALSRAAANIAARGDREAAAVRLRQAHSIAAGLGARPLAGEIESLARRAGVALTHVDTRNEPGLTARETEVLRLVAEGRTNREIAQELYISAKTVSVHVSNILAKLGASTRGEAAARCRAGSA